MMNVRIYQVDAFAERLFSGNPAAVCPLEDWLPAAVMQEIAAENNLAETAFYVRRGASFEIRWFTPAVEVDLCGHATLAAAHVVFEEDGYAADTIEFASKSGPLRVRRDGDLLELDFPADEIRDVEAPRILVEALGREPVHALKGKTDFLIVYENEDAILSLTPDIESLATVPARGIIVTAPGREVDFVSRFFAPQVGVPEDPVTGSAHTTLAPYWSGRLGKQELTAMQLSKRRGRLRCRLDGTRVRIAGRAVPYMAGRLMLGIAADKISNG
jgi:PhzF family phenazine biosynthesis protein